MKDIKKYLIGGIIGALIFGSIGVYAGTLMNSNEIPFTPKNNKWNVTKVDEALNSLYSIAVPEEYSGTTEITPTYSDITLNTQDKLLKNNITISGIPNTYKNLTNTTTITADKLASGITAYNDFGELITGTGTIGSDCIFKTYNHAANSNWNIDLEFVPTRAFFSQKNSEYPVLYYIYDTFINSTTVYQSYVPTKGNSGGGVNSYVSIGRYVTTNFPTNSASYKEAYQVPYVACK